MAKAKRGTSGGPTDKQKSKKMTENTHLGMASSEEDEAPEEVTFEDSKAAALRSMREAIDTARREKELLKEKRRKRQELFQEQKKRKLLPDDILEEIDSTVPKKAKASKVRVEKAGEGEKGSSGVGESGESDADEAEEKGDKKKKKKRRNKKKKRGGLKGDCTVVRLKDQCLSSEQQQRALDFIQSRLYGRGTHRTSVNQLLSLQNKRVLNKSAAVQFVDKKWGAERKAKAEKFKKRWKSKQGLS